MNVPIIRSCSGGVCLFVLYFFYVLLPAFLVAMKFLRRHVSAKIRVPQTKQTEYIPYFSEKKGSKIHTLLQTRNAWKWRPFPRHIPRSTYMDTPLSTPPPPPPPFPGWRAKEGSDLSPGLMEIDEDKARTINDCTRASEMARNIHPLKSRCCEGRMELFCGLNIPRNIGLYTFVLC